VANADRAESSIVSPIEIRDLPQLRDDRFISMIRELADNHRVSTEMMEFYRNKQLEEFLAELDTERAFDYVYERYSLFNIAGLRFAQRRGLPFVLEVNAPLIDEASRYRSLALIDLANVIEEYLFGNADHIITVSTELKEYVSKIAPQARVTVVPNGVRVEHFQDTGVSDHDDGSADLDSSDFIIGFVGSLKPWHGVEILIDSFAEFVSNYKKSRLLIIGGEKRLIRRLEKQYHKQGLDGKVVFTGAVPYEKIPSLLQKTDVLVAPYPELPGFYFSALKIFEYMAAGKPIIASDIGQITSILKNQETAILVPPGDGKELHDALAWLKKDQGLRSKLGENALSEARQKHTWGHRVEMITGILESLESQRGIGAKT
jgi:glycosyltransferase involved in cell wall biosynthesis